MLLKSKILIVALVLLSVAMASYPFKPVKRIDELKIPFCIDQVGYRCQVCGYDDEQKTFTAPNYFKTACLPSVNGCLKYQDLKGEVCDSDSNTYCGCGYIQNHLNNCIPTPAGFENCLRLNRAGNKCETCVSPLNAQYGGGHGDYGSSNDKTKCLDNTALNKPNCSWYKPGDTECAKCRKGYAFNAANVCTKLRNESDENCDLANDLGWCLRCQINSVWDNTNFICSTPAPDRSNQCLAFFKLPNGSDDITTCVQCEPGYIITSSGCTSLSANDATSLDGSVGFNLNQYGRWCLGIHLSYNGKQGCAIPLSRRDDYNQGAIKPSVESLAGSLCRKDKADITDLSCPSADDCYNDEDSNAIVYEKNTKRCLKISNFNAPNVCNQALKYCKIADTLGYCETCYDGYVAQNGRCQAISSDFPGCQEVNADGLSCKTCYTNYVSATSGGSYEWKYYKLNPITGKCDEQSFSNTDSHSKCDVFDDNWLCTKCEDGYEVFEGSCRLKGPFETPIGQYGCKTFADNKCTQALPGFTCDAVGYKCQVTQTDHNCLTFNASGDCDVCILPDYFKIYDDVTKKYSKCSNVSTRSDNRGCAKRHTSCGECEECKPTYSQVTRTAPNSDLGCYRSATDTGSDGLNGCVVHSSNDACTTCGFGFIKSADNKCFSLYGRRPSNSGINTGRLTGGGISTLIPEPCKTATTQFACSACQAPGADVGLRQFAAAFFESATTTENVARAYCIYNSEIANVHSGAAVSGTKALTNIEKCTTFKESTAAGNVIQECETFSTGWSLSNGAYINSADATQSNYNTVNVDPTACKGSIAWVSTKWECSACNNGYTFDPTAQNCPSVSLSGCRDGTTAADGSFTCTKCQAGYKLSVDTRTPKDLTQQCFQISNFDEAVCGTEFQCANKDLTISWPTTGTSPLAVVSSCGTGYELKNNRCIPTATVIPNCAQFLDSGVCLSCSAGFVLLNTATSTNSQTFSFQDRANLLKLRCFPEVVGCKDYNGSTGQCLSCANDATTGRIQQLDASQSVCLDEGTWGSTGCAQFALNSQTVCLKCQPGRGVPTDGCLLSTNCETWYSTEGFPDVCKACRTGYKLNYQFECVEDLYGLLGTTCTIAYNSTTCLNCADANVQVTNEDNDEATDIGLCKSSDQISNCKHISADGTKCYRCDDDYAWLNGACISNPSGTLKKCAQYQYDTDKKQLYCSECVYGYAIDGNYTTCILNTHNCTDISGGNDCSKITLLQPFTQTFECDEYRSSSLLVSFTMILALILSLIL